MEGARKLLAKALAKQYHLGWRDCGEDDGQNQDAAVARIERLLQQPSAVEPWEADAERLLEDLNRAGFTIREVEP